MYSKAFSLHHSPRLSNNSMNRMYSVQACSDGKFKLSKRNEAVCILKTQGTQERLHLEVGHLKPWRNCVIFRCYGILDNISNLWPSFSSISEKSANSEAVEELHNVGDYYCGDEDIVVVAQETTEYNEITVLKIARRSDHPLAGCTVLLLDAPGNIHSIYSPFKVWSESYYDMFATIPPILPEGPIAIYGLAGGTAARLLLELWPWLEIHGWELDAGVITVAREHFHLSELEGKEPSPHFSLAPANDAFQNVQNSETNWEKGFRDPSVYRGLNETTSYGEGFLRVHVGNVVEDNAVVEGGFAAILVDLYANGVVIPELQLVDTWQSFKERLKPGGRIMVNCGGGCVESRSNDKKDGEILMRDTVAAISMVFPEETWWQALDDGDIDSNVMVLTGSLPDPKLWAEKVPDFVKKYTRNWEPPVRLQSLRNRPLIT